MAKYWCKMHKVILALFQDDDEDVVPLDDEPSCSTFNSNEHAYSYSKYL